ncbi:A/G-specific adenine glycosylase [Pelobium manganitolerans]|uniref:Adenine DNA glycosylase n=1 Tax=Pelobium manganitolerans TaxID=1842495 RepID=A0A419S773_9SPHI|nr:A/G-specific adenine glycosylase [Pelobium manganitolerans]RKD17174.1 A/G-specific adenine glycosylase [Pelobium manganitolerans]
MNFNEELICWYRKHKRDLPWRDNRDAYRIWLSEIILQQTRVEQGMPYFYKFLDAFPRVEAFAAASEDEVLRLWQGLGYYSRGRNMLKTARKVVADFEGIFPDNYDDLLKLVGIGDYTAAAIASFAGGQAKAVVDGNVYRFLSRYFGIATPINSTAGKKEFQAVADELLDAHNPGEHNQAMIEFGALQCKPKNPDCSVCPFMAGCYAYHHNAVDTLPKKVRKLKIKERYFLYHLIKNQYGELVIKRRPNTDIWAGLYDMPVFEHSETDDPVVIAVQVHKVFKKVYPLSPVSAPVKHILTHQRLFVRFIEHQVLKEDVVLQNGWMWVNAADLAQYGMPKIIFDFLKKVIN